MPCRDGTGPLSQGPSSGRGYGHCAGRRCDHGTGQRIVRGTYPGPHANVSASSDDANEFSMYRMLQLIERQEERLSALETTLAAGKEK